MHRTTPRILAVAFAVTAILPSLVWGSDALTYDNYKRARQVLDESVAATGGAERLLALKSVRIVQKDRLTQRNQSRRVGEASPSGQTQMTVFDLDRGWVLQEIEGKTPGYNPYHNRTVVAGDEKFTVNFVTGVLTRNDQLQAGAFDGFQRAFPPLMLRRALERAASLRWVGRYDLDDKPHDVLSFSWSDGRPFTLFFDAETKLLSKYEFLLPDALHGDGVAEVIFLDYRQVDGVAVPGRWRNRISGDDLGVLEYARVELDPEMAEEDWQAPAGLTPRSPSPPPPAARLLELAPGVHLVDSPGSGYNVLFVELGDGLLAVEAPLSPQVARQAIDLVREAVPDKPIRWVVISHFHDDHSGGVQAFVAEGAKVVTIERNRDYLTRMAKASRTLAPPALDGDLAAPVFEIVDGKRTYRGGGQVVEVLSVGANVHADDLLVAWLPEHKILFSADMLPLSRDGTVNPASDVTVEFLAAVERLGLEPETWVTVHGGVGKNVDVELSLLKKKAQDQKAAR